MTRTIAPELDPPIVDETMREAQGLVKQLSSYLSLSGWSLHVISISRIVEVAPGDFRAPGATATVIPEEVDDGARAILASVLRKQADTLSPQGSEPGRGYVHDQTDYASGMSEWPK